MIQKSFILKSLDNQVSLAVDQLVAVRAIGGSLATLPRARLLLNHLQASVHPMETVSLMICNRLLHVCTLELRKTSPHTLLAKDLDDRHCREPRP